MGILIGLLISAIAVFVSAYVLPGVHVDSFVTAVIVAVVLGVLNTFLKPVLVILTLPVNILSLGLFTIVINMAILYLATYLVPGFKFDGLMWAFLFSLVLWLVNGFLHKLT
jgi:putative membrane protein